MKRLIHATLLTLAGMLILTGCSKEKQTSETQTQTKPATTEQTSQRELNVYNWQNYISNKTLEKFQQQTGIKVNYKTYASNEEMLATLENGGIGQYDLIFPSDYMVQILARKGLIDTLEIKKITSYFKLDPKFRDPTFDPGNRYAIPYTWGTSGLAIRTDKIDPKTVEKSWKLIFDPPRNLQGKISLLGDMRETLGAALKYLGYSANSTNADEIAAARDLILQNMRYYNQITSQPEPLLVNGSLWAAHTWSGDAIMTRQTDEITATRVKYIVPKEGAIIFVDNMCIPTNAPHKEAAYEFINFVLLGANAAEFVATILQPSTSHEVRDILAGNIQTEKILTDDAIYPSPETLERCEFLVDVGPAIQHYEAAWQQILQKSPKP